MMKIKLFIGLIIFLVMTTSVILFFNIVNVNTGKRDKFALNITYRDEERKIPIGLNIIYEISNKKFERFVVMTDENGNLPIAYEATIEKGAPLIRINLKGKFVKEIKIIEKDKINLKLLPNTSYTLEIVIDYGIGNINLRWMEMA
ncbi:MAG: hypothetical protein PHQ32_02925 [Firmicutes bacterium]|nr:hypothetical protein [Bacillota bacterium]